MAEYKRYNQRDIARIALDNTPQADGSNRQQVEACIMEAVEEQAVTEGQADLWAGVVSAPLATEATIARYGPRLTRAVNKEQRRRKRAGEPALGDGQILQVIIDALRQLLEGVGGIEGLIELIIRLIGIFSVRA